MISRVPPPLIQAHYVDAAKGTIRLVMPKVDDVIAKSIEMEIQMMDLEKKYPVHLEFRHEAGAVQITIQSDDIGVLGLTTVRVMTRTVRDLAAPPHAPQPYGSVTDTQAILNTLQEYAEQKSLGSVAAIAVLKDISRNIEPHRWK